MKTFPLVFSFLFLAFVTKPLLGAPEPLVDTNGDKVQTGNAYRLVSLAWGALGGDLTLGNGTNGLCPLAVVQLFSDVIPGLPFVFAPINSTLGEQTDVYDSTDLNIIALLPTILVCNNLKVWNVDNYDQSTGQWFITTNGEVGNPGPQTLTSWFKFEKVDEENTYKIKYCPSVCESCETLCSDLGIYYSNNLRRLALSNNPFLLKIRKVDVCEERLSV